MFGFYDFLALSCVFFLSFFMFSVLEVLDVLSLLFGGCARFSVELCVDLVFIFFLRAVFFPYLGVVGFVDFFGIFLNFFFEIFY